VIQYLLRANSFFVALATLFLLSACFNRVPVFTEADIPCQLNVSEKTAPPSAAPEIAIHVDGSGSMLGYVKPTNSRYIQMLEVLDSIFISSKPKYYRSGGEKNQQLSRQNFRKADLPDFYTGSNPKFPKVSSQLDAAITSPGETKKLLVFVTDLDQNDADVNSLINKIEETYLKDKKNSYAVGILAVKSEFDGTVYTNNPRSRPDFLYNTQGKQPTAYRPFYVIFLGSYPDIVEYYEAIKNSKQELVANAEFTVFSPKAPVKQVVYLQGSSELPDGIERPFSLNNGQVSVEVNTPPYEVLAIDKNLDRKELSIAYNLPLSPLGYTLLPQANSIEAKYLIQSYDSFDRKFKKSDSTSLTQAVEQKDWKITPDKLQFQTIIRQEAFPEPGIYLFTVDAVVKDWQTPDWWNNWDWTTRKDNQDGSKTYNLLNFMENLKRTTTNLMSVDDSKPVIGRFCYAIQKK
jgi:hypothetical protein